MDTNELFGKEKISKVLLKLAPPVMLAQLIQALYNLSLIHISEPTRPY